MAHVGYKIDNSGVYFNDGSTKAEPNTKGYATGNEYETGITIEVLSSGEFIEVHIILEPVEGTLSR
jgi:hypothetical protein